MSSETKPPSRRASSLVLALLALFTLLVGCGKKGAPMPPPSKLPQPVSDLKVERWGDTVRLEFTYPTVTVGGLPLSGIKGVEVWEVVRPFVAQPVAPTTTTTPAAGPTTETPPSTGEEGSVSEASAASSTEPPATEPAEGETTSEGEHAPVGESTNPEATQAPSAEQQSSSSSSTETAPSTESTSSEQTAASSTTGETSTTGTTATTGTTGTTTTAAPVSVAPPQPTISSFDFKGSAKQLTTVEGDDLKQAILGGKILLQIPASSLHTLPPPPPKEGESGEAPASTEPSSQPAAESTSESETAATATQPEPSETTSPQASEPSAATAPEETAESPTGEQAQTPATEPTAAEAETAAAEGTTATPAMPKPTVEEVHFLAVRTISQDGKTSDFSRIVYLVAGTPPPPPTDLTATTSEDGVELAWSLPTLPEGSKLDGVQVYRRSQDESVFEVPLTTLSADATEYTDRSAQFGQQYTYAVGAVGRARPLIQSVLSESTSLLYEDIYQPAAPARLDLFPEAERVRLIWEASTSPDVTGYRVERAGSDGRFDILTSVLLTTPEYIDHDVERGATYSYRIVALDDAGNASEPSPIETTRIP